MGIYLSMDICLRLVGVELFGHWICSAIADTAQQFSWSSDQCAGYEVPPPPHRHQPLVGVFFFILAILVAVYLYRIMILIFISLMTS